MIFPGQDFIDACRAVQRKREAGTVTYADYADLDCRFPGSVQSTWGSKVIHDIATGDDIHVAVRKLNGL